MRPASVGFQCPSCVKEGAKTTRTARTPYGGERVANPQLTTIVLIAINVAVYLGTLANGGTNGALFDKLALLPRSAIRYLPDGSIQRAIEGVSGGAWWQPVTSMFVHESIYHIGFNMVALWFLGPQLELMLGRARFLSLYFVSGLTGSAVVMWLAAANAQTVGASGAIFGLMGALLVVAVKIHANTQQILFWIGINVVFTVTGGNISWQGHLGGFIGGAVIALLIVYAPRKNRAPLQWSGLAVIALAAVVAIVLRASALG
jgi:membrane associated rhomboid family serine protease